MLAYRETSLRNIHIHLVIFPQCSRLACEALLLLHFLFLASVTLCVINCITLTVKSSNPQQQQGTLLALRRMCYVGTKHCRGDFEQHLASDLCMDLLINDMS